MKIGEREIGLEHPTYFIADLASNHGGDLKIAKELIKEAAGAGANAAKFQHFKAKTLVSDIGFRDLHNIESHQKSWDSSVFETYRKMEVPDQWTLELSKVCQEEGIEFLTTPYDINMISDLNPYLSAFKIGSGDLTYHDLILTLAKLGKPILIATGASTLVEVSEIIYKLNEFKSEIVLMQCNTNYTGNEINSDFTNLKVIQQYQTLFPEVIVGLSDHTLDDLTTLASITLGARVIEKHFKGKNSPNNPDFSFSLSGDDWNKMVKKVRRLEKALGDGIKKVEQNEINTRILQRRSIRYRYNLKSGHVINVNDFVFLRPSPINSFNPSQSHQFIGKTLIKDVYTEECVDKSHFSLD